MQLKVVVVSVQNPEPHLVMVASRPIDVGEEILFDYNDRQSTIAFLKKCPVCDDQPTDRQEAPAASTSQPAAEPSSQNRQQRHTETQV